MSLKVIIATGIMTTVRLIVILAMVTMITQMMRIAIVHESCAKMRQYWVSLLPTNSFILGQLYLMIIILLSIGTAASGGQCASSMWSFLCFFCFAWSLGQAFHQELRFLELGTRTLQMAIPAENGHILSGARDGVR